MALNRSTVSAKPKSCFVLMPFGEPLDEIYEEIIKDTVEESGYTCLRADEIYRPTPIVQDIWEEIQGCGFLIADLTGRNPNVFYGLGLAHAIQKDVILITQNIDDVPFDLRHIRCIVYNRTLRGLRRLSLDLRRMIVEIKDPTRFTLEFIEGLQSHFDVKSVEVGMAFSGRRGNVTTVREAYEVTARDHEMPAYYKKVSIPGSLGEVRFYPGSSKIRTLLPGAFIIASKLARPIPRDKDGSFQIEYTLFESFSHDSEFWFFEAEGRIDEISARLEFSNECEVEDVRVYRKVGTDPEIEVGRAQLESSADGQVATWNSTKVLRGVTYFFRWRWRDGIRSDEGSST